MQDRHLFPREVTADVPRITLVGSETVRIEQHHGLKVYQPELILFRTGAGQVRVTGEALCFASYGAGEALITGEINSVSVEAGTKGGRQP